MQNYYSISLFQVIDQNERVGFIGISNWALDPAKMNRGIMVIRGNPSQEELEESALYVIYCFNVLMLKYLLQTNMLRRRHR